MNLSNAIIRKFAGFSVVGFVVTLISWIISFILLKILETPLYITYILVYGVTIFISFFLEIKGASSNA